MKARLEQIDFNDWNEIGYPEYIAILPIYPQDLRRKQYIEFVDYEDEGLGLARGAAFKIKGVQYFVRCHLIGDEEEDQLTVMVRSTEPDSEHALTLLLKALKIERSTLPWEQESLGKCSWLLSRLDDNGNEVEMFRFLNEDSARINQKKYAAKGHKQSYFVTQLESPQVANGI